MAAAAVALPTMASLSHLQDLPVYHNETPYEIWADNVAPHIPKTNVQLEIIKDCPIQDVRTTKKEQPRLETHGFEWLEAPFPQHTGITGASSVGFESPEQQVALTAYLEDIDALMKARLGCTKVLCWDWRVRRITFTKPPTSPNIYSVKGKSASELRATPINSSHLIHSDGSPRMMQKVLKAVNPPEEPQWLDFDRYRVRAITVWRPLVDVVETDPLVLCDTRTVEPTDWDIVEKVLEDTIEESMYLKRRNRHQWYWMSGQTKDQAIVMTIWDSDRAWDRSASAAHGAMSLDNAPENARPRESIEVRLLVWNEK